MKSVLGSWLRYKTVWVTFGCNANGVIRMNKSSSIPTSPGMLYLQPSGRSGLLCCTLWPCG